MQTTAPLPRRLLVAALACAWGLRLGTYLAIRLRRHGGDSRYESMERTYSNRLQRFYFGFFLLQGLAAAIYAMPMMAAAVGPWPSFMLFVGVGFVLFGIVMVTISDFQLARFKKTNTDPAALCRSGLWSWSRHPNYFFEWLTWCGWAIMAFDGDAWWIALGGAALMLYFLLKVSGIPHVEREAIRKRGDAYREYQRTTSMFIPLPPRTGRKQHR
jgi:steroid 5-alpha reductase family enzyme